MKIKLAVREKRHFLAESVRGSKILGYRGSNVAGFSMWVRRAIKEEFGLTDELFDAVFDIESIRVLGLDIEADIINYSLPCVIRMNKKCDEFKDIICNTIDTKEISYLDSLSLNEIPAVLLSWAPDKESNWHPSSYLRLLLFLIHHKGYKRTSQMLSKEQRKNKKHSKK